MTQAAPPTAESDSKSKGTFPGSVSGTYLHVKVEEDHWAPCKFDFPPDLGYSVLYLLPRGSFAWFTYWQGFHYGRCAGRFTRNGATLHLQGRDTVICDCPSANYSGKTLDRQVTLRHTEGKRVLLGLSQKEHLFIGWGIHIPFKGAGRDLFPKGWEELQGWIEGFLGTMRNPETS